MLNVPFSSASAPVRRLLPRCVEAQGGITGGNFINYTSPALTLADVDAKAAAEAKAARYVLPNLRQPFRTHLCIPST